MIRTRSIAAATAVVAAAGLALIPVPAQAAGSVHLYKVYYDSPGSDRGANSSLNAEYVQIRNTTGASVQLRGWTLTDAVNHRYTFGTFTLAKGKTVTVRTGKGTNTSVNRYQGRAWYVWNNDKDTATLRRANGTRVDVCSYNSTRADYRMC
ncbi:lamin tail domain-containing protein [Streptomyces sp. TRM 70351]|uniref:lamin tail domain-containing protein n=1 Tax=Streptomyces sp. TRM 70351 TaxID=3116552 RepID=UPI002E7C375C|nr:lamin tail domain-containing protein [Streptomyces sp. TRM 70351]MEE1927419.1 lamin tail domain-containing protein [Streptomyces sp. TRM 70351]